jgi:hypothetical protein
MAENSSPGESAPSTEAAAPHVNRRTVLKAAAWTAPAILVASQLPAAATGTPPLVELDFGNADACKLSGNSWKALCYNKGYVLFVPVTNNGTAPITVTGVQSMVVGGQDQCVVAITTPFPSCYNAVLQVIIDGGQTVLIGIFSNADDDSSSDTVTVTLKYSYVDGEGNVIDTTSEPQSGVVKGGAWGSNSCNYPRPESECPRTPPTACGTSCGTPQSLLLDQGDGSDPELEQTDVTS